MNIVGIFRMTLVEEKKPGGDWCSQPFEMGMMAFGPDGSVSLNQRSSGASLFSYLGDTRYEGSELVIRTRVCSLPEMEGKEMRRTVEVLQNGGLRLGGIGARSGGEFRITWQKLL